MTSMKLPKLLAGEPEKGASVFMGDPLALDRCPRCGIAKPLLIRHWTITTSAGYWAVHICSVCEQAILATGIGEHLPMMECLPSTRTFSEHLPKRARECLKQAADSLAQPAASVVVSAAAVDAMLKAKDLKNGSLYGRIDQAAKDHLITEGMAKWAHQVRLDANAQRHADEGEPLPTQADARRCLDFALALGEFLFVLPARVTRGITDTKITPGTA
jgi:hypothetical protein